MTINCAGMNCRHPEENHSPECVAEHAASVAGGRFVKPSAPAVDASAHMTFIVDPSQSIDEVLPADRRWVIANAVSLIAGYRNCKTGETKAAMQHIVDYLRAALSASTEAATISIQEAWEAAGGNPGIKATREELLTALRDLDAVADGVPPKGSANAPFVVDQSDPLWPKHLYENMKAAYEHYAANPQPASTEAAAGEPEAIDKWLHIDDVKGLCRDFSSRTGSVYIKDVESALDGLEAFYTAPPAASGQMLTDEQRGFFVYDPSGSSFEFYDTDAERDAAHREAIKEFRNEALLDGEWSLDVESIVSGVVTHTTIETDVLGEQCDYAPALLRASSATASDKEGQP